MYVVEKWYLDNINELETIYGKVFYDNNCFQWIKIKSFDMPDIYYQQSTVLLIMTPGLSGIEIKDNYKFFVEKGLWRKDGKSNEHLYEGGSYNDLSNKNYARLSIHFKSFMPKLKINEGDKISDLCDSVYNFFAIE